MAYFFFFDFDEETGITEKHSVEVSDQLDQGDFEFFADTSVRKVWNRTTEEWYFSVQDVVQVLTDSNDPKD